MQKKNVTSTVQTAQYLTAMLEGAYATSLENRIAQMNNQLAREGRMSNDPLVQIMLGLRHDLKAEGCTFERQVPQFAPVAPVASVQAAPVEAPKAPRPATQAAPKAATATPKVTFTVREIKAEQLASVQVPGSETDIAIYGTDKQGRVLAPYGLKNDGSPARRRGRVAATASDEPQATMPEPAKAAPVQAAPAATIEFDEETVAATPVIAASEIEDEDFDALLNGID